MTESDQAPLEETDLRFDTPVTLPPAERTALHRLISTALDALIDRTHRQQGIDALSIAMTLLDDPTTNTYGINPTNLPAGVLPSNFTNNQSTRQGDSE